MTHADSERDQGTTGAREDDGPAPARRGRRERGWALPAAPGEGGGIPLVEDDLLVRRAIEGIVLTRPGERLMLPRFGCRAHELLFRPLTPAVLDAIAFRVEDAVRRFEDRIVPTQVRARRDPQHPGAVWVDLQYRTKRGGRTGLVELRLGPDAPSAGGGGGRRP